mmetsp:Transcript_18939/g.45650  ORF Transcript_18939/g.45650 Transcript_18939/m.45650 type:complete len:285 (-) Transcript_18939:277-1131(-)
MDGWRMALLGVGSCCVGQPMVQPLSCPACVKTYMRQHAAAGHLHASVCQIRQTLESWAGAAGLERDGRLGVSGKIALIALDCRARGHLSTRSHLTQHTQQVSICLSAKSTLTSSRWSTDGPGSLQQQKQGSLITYTHRSSNRCLVTLTQQHPSLTPSRLAEELPRYVLTGTRQGRLEWLSLLRLSLEHVAALCDDSRVGPEDDPAIRAFVEHEEQRVQVLKQRPTPHLVPSDSADALVDGVHELQQHQLVLIPLAHQVHHHIVRRPEQSQILADHHDLNVIAPG